MKFWIIESHIYSKTWYLFRDNGTEIMITIAISNVNSEFIKSQLPLTEREIRHFNKYYRKIKIKNVRMKKK